MHLSKKEKEVVVSTPGHIIEPRFSRQSPFHQSITPGFHGGLVFPGYTMTGRKLQMG